MERGVRWFEFEQGDSGERVFEVVGPRLEAEQGEYTFIDSPGSGTRYYRVRETDEDWRRVPHGGQGCPGVEMKAWVKGGDGDGHPGWLKPRVV